jgi:hypothetical protein
LTGLAAVIELTEQRALRAVRNLPFCYLCGVPFNEGDDHDHIPPKSIFALADRQPLKLKTHKVCNERHSLDDEKVGQMISAARGNYPEKEEDRKLRVAHLGIGFGAVTNLNVDGVLWRWITGFHAALYREPLRNSRGSIVTPFPRADKNANGLYSLAPIYEQQHQVFVDTIKAQRWRNELDRIVANNKQLTYECAWGPTDDNSAWLCIFALNIYDWKKMGTSPIAPARGCAGCYTRPTHPPNATLVSNYTVTTPNVDPLDPFGR